MNTPTKTPCCAGCAAGTGCSGATGRVGEGGSHVRLDPNEFPDPDRSPRTDYVLSLGQTPSSTSITDRPWFPYALVATTLAAGIGLAFLTHRYAGRR